MPRSSSLPRLTPCVYPRQTFHTAPSLLPGAAGMRSQCSQPQRGRQRCHSRSYPKSKPGGVEALEAFTYRPSEKKLEI